jgi:hypothetical protein
VYTVNRLPSNTLWNLLNYGLQVYFQTHLITASKLWNIWHPSISPNSVSYSNHVRIIMATKYRSLYLVNYCLNVYFLLARIQPPTFDHHGLYVHPHTWLTPAFKAISKLAWSQPSSVSLNLPEYSHQVHMITASMGIYKLTRLWPPNISLSSPDYQC